MGSRTITGSKHTPQEHLNPLLGQELVGDTRARKWWYELSSAGICLRNLEMQNDQALDRSSDSQVGYREGAVNSSFGFLPGKAVLTGLEE